MYFDAMLHSFNIAPLSTLAEMSDFKPKNTTNPLLITSYYDSARGVEWAESGAVRADLIGKHIFEDANFRGSV